MSLLFTRAPKLLLIPALFFLFGYRKIAAFSFTFLLLFFRNPKPIVSKQTENHFLSPSYGTVQSIKFTPTHVYISVFLGLLDPHVQYTPIDSMLIDQKYIKGTFNPITILTSQKTKHNERMTNTFENNNLRYQVVQIAGAIARTIDPFVAPTTVLQQGTPFGMIQFGSRVDTILPIQFADKIKVRKGQYVQGGITRFF